MDGSVGEEVNDSGQRAPLLRNCTVALLPKKPAEGQFCKGVIFAANVIVIAGTSSCVTTAFCFLGVTHIGVHLVIMCREKVGWGERCHLYPGFLFFRSRGVQVTVVDTSQDSKPWQTLTVLSAAGSQGAAGTNHH